MIEFLDRGETKREEGRLYNKVKKKWVGNKEVGEGAQEITGIINNEAIYSQLRFLKPFKSKSDAYLIVENEDGGTKVTWGFSGINKFPVSILMLFMNMDKTVGKDFEYGLNKLQKILER